MGGMDLKLIKTTCNITNLPIIFSGGIGSIDDIRNAFKFNISGVSAGSFFVFYGPHKAVLISYPYEEFEKVGVVELKEPLTYLRVKKELLFEK